MVLRIGVDSFLSCYLLKRDSISVNIVVSMIEDRGGQNTSLGFTGGRGRLLDGWRWMISSSTKERQGRLSNHRLPCHLNGKVCNRLMTFFVPTTLVGPRKWVSLPKASMDTRSKQSDAQPILGAKGQQWCSPKMIRDGYITPSSRSDLANELMPWWNDT